MKPEGGHQNPRDWAGQQNKLRPNREPARCMFTAEFVSILRRFKSPRFDSCGVTMTRHGNNPRAERGLDQHGTIYFNKPNEKRDLYAVPYGCIPYTTIRTARWDADLLRWVGGELKRGWRRCLRDLVDMGYLRPCEELSYLVGEDTYRIGPKQFRR